MRELRGKPIITLTLNPSIDASSQANEVRPIHKIRTSGERFDPGGGGINVARIVRELGAETRAIYLAGGATGGTFNELLDAASIPRLPVAIAGHTRICHAVYEHSTHLEYRFVSAGPTVEDAEWRSLLGCLEEIDCDYLVASGSLPMGVPVDFYAMVARLARKKGIRLVLDSSGEALSAGLEEGVFLVKPSLSELEGLCGNSLADANSQEHAVRELVKSTRAQIVALTLGRDGALLASSKGTLRHAGAKVETRSAVGAGDSFLGAMTLRLSQGHDEEDAFLYGMSAGAATAMTPGTELCARADVERIYSELRRPSPKQGQP